MYGETGPPFVLLVVLPLKVLRDLPPFTALILAHLANKFPIFDDTTLIRDFPQFVRQTTEHLGIVVMLLPKLGAGAQVF